MIVIWSTEYQAHVHKTENTLAVTKEIQSDSCYTKPDRHGVLLNIFLIF